MNDIELILKKLSSDTVCVCAQVCQCSMHVTITTVGPGALQPGVEMNGTTQRRVLKAIALIGPLNT